MEPEKWDDDEDHPFQRIIRNTILEGMKSLMEQENSEAKRYVHESDTDSPPSSFGQVSEQEDTVDLLNSSSTVPGSTDEETKAKGTKRKPNKVRFKGNVYPSEGCSWRVEVTKKKKTKENTSDGKVYVSDRYICDKGCNTLRQALIYRFIVETELKQQQLAGDENVFKVEVVDFPNVC